jgi:hypothetical protein
MRCSGVNAVCAAAAVIKEIVKPIAAGALRIRFLRINNATRVCEALLIAAQSLQP